MRNSEQIASDISRNRREFNDARRAVEADQGLTAYGKAEKVRKLQEAADAKHSALIEERKAAIAAERDALYAAAFKRGIGLLDNYRDAYAKAYDASPADLAKMQAQAARTYDDALGRACRQAAYDRGLDNLLADAPDAVHTLREFEVTHGLRSSGDRARDLERRLGESMLTGRLG